MLKRLSAALAFTLVIALGLPSFALAKTGSQAAGTPVAKEPTIRQVFEAADAGRLKEADAMIAKVLKNHPRSAKAHFAHAQLLAMQDQLDDARDALSRAKELSPGLAFAKADAVDKLERKLEKPPEVVQRNPLAELPLPMPVDEPGTEPEPEAESGFGPFLWVPIGAIVLALIAYLVFRRRPATRAPSRRRYSRTTDDTSNSYRDDDDDDYSTQRDRDRSAAMATTTALATGAAVGVGAVVAGEALRQQMQDRSDSTVDRDFGIKDTSSWDDSSSSSDSSSSDSGSSDSGSSDSSSSD